MRYRGGIKMKQYDVIEIDLMGCDPGNDWVHVNVLAEFVLNGKHYTRKIWTR